MCLYNDVRYNCIIDTAVVDEIAHFIEKVEHNIKDCRNCFMDTTVVNELLQNAEKQGYDTESDTSDLYEIFSIEGFYKTKHAKHSCRYATNKSNGCDTLRVTTIIKDKKMFLIEFHMKLQRMPLDGKFSR